MSLFPLFAQELDSIDNSTKSKPEAAIRTRVDAAPVVPASIAAHVPAVPYQLENAPQLPIQVIPADEPAAAAWKQMMETMREMQQQLAGR